MSGEKSAYEHNLPQFKRDSPGLNLEYSREFIEFFHSASNVAACVYGLFLGGGRGRRTCRGWMGGDAFYFACTQALRQLVE